MSTAIFRIARRMASLPLFSSSFMPKDDASFGPARPERSAVPPQRAAGVGVHRRPPATDPTRHAAFPAMRSLFDPLPAPAPTRPSSPSGEVPPSQATPSTPSTPMDAAPSQPSATLPRSSIGDRPAAPKSTASASNVERTEAALREAGLAGRFWRGDALSASSSPSRPSGFRALDEQLPDGGWPSRCMTELLLSQAGIGEIRFLASTLSSLIREGREIVLLGPPYVPDPTGWEQLGIDMRHVLIVRTPRPADRLWAIEQSLKSAAFGALIAWLPEERMLARHDTLRRLQLAAASADGLTFVMRPLTAQRHASPAPLRLALSAGPPEDGRQTLSVQLLKRRGPVLTRPLTLALPEIHRGMRAFNPVRRATGQAKPPSRSAPSPLPSSPQSIETVVTHALAGPVLSDARA